MIKPHGSETLNPLFVYDPVRHRELLQEAEGDTSAAQDWQSARYIALIRNYSRGQLLEMAEKARSLAKPDATEEVANICAEIAK